MGRHRSRFRFCSVLFVAGTLAACTGQLTEVTTTSSSSPGPTSTVTSVPPETRITALEPTVVPRTEDPSDVIEVGPEMDVAAVVASSAAGSTFRFRPGLYRGVMIEPKADMIFVADDGVVLRGSVPVAAFSEDGDVWRAPAPIAGATDPVQGEDWGYCDDDRPACVYPEDLFVDGTALVRVGRLADVTAGSWFFDPSGDIVMGDDPQDREVEIGAVPYAFHGQEDRVTIAGLVIEQYATPGRQGVVNPRVGRIGPAGVAWTVSGNVLRNNHGWGVKLEDGMTVERNEIDANGQGGIGGVAEAVVIESNRIVGNCTAGFRCFGWEGGGLKLETDDIVIRNNLVEANLGHGIHTDRGADRVVIEGNTVTDNLGAGIHHEISGEARIADNVVTGNGFAPGRPAEPGILVLSSSRTVVENNTLSGNALGIVLRQDHRWQDGVLNDVTVRFNMIDTALGPAAVMGGTPGPDFEGAWAQNLEFERNRYRFGYDVTVVDPFRWEGAPIGIDGWQRLGNDVAGDFELG